MKGLRLKKTEDRYGQRMSAKPAAEIFVCFQASLVFSGIETGEG
jgi:hypothetical protein